MKTSKTYCQHSWLVLRVLGVLFKLTRMGGILGLYTRFQLMGIKQWKHLKLTANTVGLFYVF